MTGQTRPQPDRARGGTFAAAQRLPAHDHALAVERRHQDPTVGEPTTRPQHRTVHPVRLGHPVRPGRFGRVGRFVSGTVLVCANVAVSAATRAAISRSCLVWMVTPVSHSSRSRRVLHEP